MFFLEKISGSKIFVENIPEAKIFLASEISTKNLWLFFRYFFLSDLHL